MSSDEAAELVADLASWQLAVDADELRLRKSRAGRRESARRLAKETRWSAARITRAVNGALAGRRAPLSHDTVSRIIG
jgi:hypothetical protein